MAEAPAPEGTNALTSMSNLVPLPRARMSLLLRPLNPPPLRGGLTRKTVSFGDTETRMIESSFPCPVFGPVNRERNLNYSWPEEIRGLNSAREKRRAHVKAVVWREQVLLDDVDAETLGNDACVLELTHSKQSACEVFAAAVTSIRRVRRLMLDSGCGIDLV